MRFIADGFSQKVHEKVFFGNQNQILAELPPTFPKALFHSTIFTGLMQLDCPIVCLLFWTAELVRENWNWFHKFLNGLDKQTLYFQNNFLDIFQQVSINNYLSTERRLTIMALLFGKRFWPIDAECESGRILPEQQSRLYKNLSLDLFELGVNLHFRTFLNRYRNVTCYVWFPRTQTGLAEFARKCIFLLVSKVDLGSFPNNRLTFSHPGPNQQFCKYRASSCKNFILGNVFYISNI